MPVTEPSMRNQTDNLVSTGHPPPAEDPDRTKSLRLPVTGLLQLERIDR